MNRTILWTLFLAFTGCLKTETDIDNTTIRGNIVVPSASTTEGDDAGANDSWLTPAELPMLHYRNMTVTGNAASFGGETFGLEPDDDNYKIAAKDDGLLDVSIAFTTDQGMGRDKTIFELYLYDLDNAEEDCTSEFSCAASDCACEATYDATQGGCVEATECEEECSWEIVEAETCEMIAAAGGSTDGSLGYYSTSIEVSGGGNYGIQVVASDSSEYEEGTDYTLELGALTPDDGTFLVGAYQSDDINERGNPVGGASVYDLEWDSLNEMWVGKFEMLYIKEVITTVDTGTGEEDHVVNEGAPGGQVYLLGGSLPSLNAAIPSGTLYSTQAVLVNTGDGDSVVGNWGLDTAEETEEPETADSGDTGGVEPVAAPTGEIVLTIDALQPRVVGWEHDEVEPNEVTMDDSLYFIVEELSNADAVPDASLGIYTDIIHGDVTLDTEFPDWANEYVDVFAITVTEDTNATFTFEWDTSTADHDFIMYGSDGAYYAYSLYAYPEIIDTAQWGFSLDAGSTWYLLVLPYAGIVGDDPYTIEIEYAAL